MARPSDFLPSRYKGEGNPLSHWLQFQDYCTEQNIAAADIVNKFKITLAGDARLWFDNKQFIKEEDLKRWFIKHFSGVHSREGTVAAFHGCKYIPGETMEAYLTRLSGFAERLGYNNDLIADQFREGLPYDLQVQVTMQRCNTLEELTKTAQKYAALTACKPIKEVTVLHNDFQAQIETL